MAAPVPFAQRTKPATTNVGSLSNVQVVTSHGHTAVSHLSSKVVVEHTEGYTNVMVDPTNSTPTNGIVLMPMPNPPTMTSPLKPISISLQISSPDANVTVEHVCLVIGQNMPFTASQLAQSDSFSIPISADSTIPYEMEEGISLILGVKSHVQYGRLCLACASVVFST